MSLSDIVPPAAAPLYRGWKVWHDLGHYEHGIVYRETKWRALSPDGELLEHPFHKPGEKPVDGYAWLLREIDSRT